jgi:hypothetical protein
MSTTGYGWSSAIPGSFQDQWWHAAGNTKLSIQKAAVPKPSNFLLFGVVADT